MLNRKGFTMVELLVVLVIIAILAAVATPLYIANTKRAKASEAVAAMGLMRQAQRDFQINNNTYFDVLTDDVQDPLPAYTDITLTSGAVGAGKGLAVDVGIPQYFSNAAYTIEAKGTTGTLAAPTGTTSIFQNPGPVDFLIKVDGSASVLCASGTVSNCAIKASDVGQITGTTDDYVLYMDNTGRIAISYNGSTFGNY